MLLAEVFLQLGEENFRQLVRGISIGRLRTYRLYESFKTRAHLGKLNTETLQKAIPRLWARISEKEEELASEVAQAVLLGYLDLIRAVLDFLGIPNEDGFFVKNLDASPYLTPGWQQRVYEKFHGVNPEGVLLLYINHLAWELDKSAGFFAPAPAA